MHLHSRLDSMASSHFSLLQKRKNLFSTEPVDTEGENRRYNIKREPAEQESSIGKAGTTCNCLNVYLSFINQVIEQ